MKQVLLMGALTFTLLATAASAGIGALPAITPEAPPATAPGTVGAPGDEVMDEVEPTPVKLEDLLLPEAQPASNSCCTIQEEISATRVCLRICGPECTAVTICTPSGGCTFSCQRL